MFEFKHITALLYSVFRPTAQTEFVGEATAQSLRKTELFAKLLRIYEKKLSHYLAS